MSLGYFIPSTSTVLCLNFDAGNNTDISPTPKTGTDTNMAYGLNYGRFGQGAYFAGTSWISYASNSAFYPTNLTINAWVYSTTINASNSIWGASANYGLVFKFDSSAIRMDSANIVQIGAATGLTISANTWYNFAVTWNRSSGPFIFYLNGLQVGSGSSTYNSFVQQTQYIGRGTATTSDGKITGYIDNHIFENRVWSASEIQKYYTMTKGRFGIL